MNKLKQSTVHIVAVLLSALLRMQAGAALPWTLPTPDSSAKTALIPYPQQIDWSGGDLDFSSYVIQTDEGTASDGGRFVVQTLEELLKEAGGRRATDASASVPVRIFIDSLEGHGSPEGYRLTVTPDALTLTAPSVQGLFYGVQTIRQLMMTKDGKNVMAGCSIKDWPAFGLRGVMLDVGRNFMSVEFLKKQAEILSRYKINTLHLHLTEDAAWRIEIKQYPQLTKAENHWKTRQPGKYYTQEEIKDLVEFCRQRQITVIPEIDMPGHSEAFRHAMGVDMQTEAGLEILKNILDEIVELFPSPYIHIGSDEVRIRMKEFMPAMVSHVRSKGREVIVWNPGYLPDRQVINMHWGDHDGQRVDPSMRHISTIGFYMDWIDSQSGVYQYFFQQPCGVASGNANAMGAITCVWTDAALSGEDRVLIQYPFYPCSLTFAERIWRGAREERRDLFAKLPQPGTRAYRAFAEFEDRLIIHRDKYFKDLPFAYVRQSQIPWRLIGPFDHKGVNDTSFEPERIIKEEYKDGENTLTWEPTPAWGSAIHLRHFYSMFNRHQNRVDPNYWPATMNHRVGGGDGTCYALTHVYSPKSQDVYLMFGIGGMWGHTGGYRTARAPEQGEWDFSGGDLWLNDQRVNPPHWPFESLPWTGWGKGRIEIPLTEEGYFFRPPVAVRLEKGWNKILVRVPFGSWKGDNGQRKWFFNCCPVTWDGKHYREVEELRYSAKIGSE